MKPANAWRRTRFSGGWAEVLRLEPEYVVWGEKGPPEVEETSRPPDFAQAIAELVRLLDDESLEDLYNFLKSQDPKTFRAVKGKWPKRPKPP